MARQRLHNRQPQQGTVPTIISGPTNTADLGSAVVTAAPQTTYTIVTRPYAVPSIGPDGIPTTQTVLSVISVTDPVEYASITSAVAQSSSSTTRPSSTFASATPSATTAPAKSSSNLHTLIPAIVVPVVVILLALFGLFWFYMRRRHRREIRNQPELARAGKGEKLSSRTTSTHSSPTSVTHKAAFEKLQPKASVTELSNIKETQVMLPRHSEDDIGVAKPMTPKDPRSRSPVREFQPLPSTKDPRQYQNFSGPRPSTARRAPPSRKSDTPGRNRSNSSPSKGRQPQVTFNRNASRDESTTRAGSSPRLEIPNVQPDSPNGSSLRDPSPTMSQKTRAKAPPRIKAPPPGAYNGGSAISRYSPIVKETPNIPAPFAKPHEPTLPVLPPVNPFEPESARSESPVSVHTQDLSEENMRIAKLANSSRLNLAPESSPNLPPPATRSQLIPQPSPLVGINKYPNNRMSDKHDTTDRESFVSAPDDYEDIDAKSEVSSLDEFERFDFEDSLTSPPKPPRVRDYLSEGVMGGNGRGSPF